MKKNLLLFIPLILLSCSNFDFNSSYDPDSVNYNPPMDFKVSQAEFNYIELKWDAVEFAKYYIIYKTSLDNPKEILIILGSNITSYIDYDVLYGIDYYYTIKAELTTGVVTDESNPEIGTRNEPCQKFCYSLLIDESPNSEEAFEHQLGSPVNTDNKLFKSFMIDLDNAYPGLQLIYRIEIDTTGWTSWVTDATTLYGGAFRINKFELKTYGDRADEFDVYYTAKFTGTPDNLVFPDDYYSNGQECPLYYYGIGPEFLDIRIVEKE